MVDSFIKKTKYWHKLDDGRVQCDLCPRECKLHEGQQGLCFVRENRENEIVLTTYGLSSGFCIDPIEKKPLNHFLPGTPVFSFGTAGCNLACKFCQNWDISKSREVHTLADAASPEMIAKTAVEYGCKSVAFTYNDPVIFHEYAIDVAKECHKNNVKTVAVTAGYISPEPRVEFFKHMDAANVDLKAFTERFYHKITGSHLEPILETLKYIKHETDCWLETTTLIIPSENDSEKEITEMCEWVVENLGPDMPMHFSAFHPDFKMMDYPSTPPSTLTMARDIAMKAGVRYAYVGNVHNRDADSTWCHHCGELLIERDWYELGKWNLDAHGNCKNCGTKVAGIFEPTPGNWGSKRLPVRMKGKF